MNRLSVSVVMITYGHEQFIKQAIEGVLMQQCDFELELILANDCSPDLTDTVVKEILENHPKSSWIKYTKHPENIGMMPNFILALKQETAKYIALCEGDDYWTDPLKLQKQVDFLEANPDFGLVCTNYTSQLITFYSKSKEIFLKDILKDSAVGTLTSMFKNSLIQTYIDNLQLSMGDFQLWLYLCKKQRVYKLADITANYRVLEDSATGRDNPLRLKKFSLDVLNIVETNLHLINSTLDHDAIVRERYGQLFKTLISLKDKEFHYYQMRFFKVIKRLKIIDFKRYTIGFIKIYLT
jgi:glycosyltransferase involved in cell wall biosynthesis